MYKVMLVDDEDLIREDLETIIEWDKLNLQLVYSAIDGLDALNHISVQQPDIIITDIRMPVIDGLQLIQTVKESYPNITFVILSGYSDFEYAQKAIKYGVKDYLLKPVSVNDLNNCLSKILVSFDETVEKEQEKQQLIKKYETVKSIASENLFRELLEGKDFALKNWFFYQSLNHLNIEPKDKVLLFFYLYPKNDMYQLFALQNISREIIGEHHIILDTKFSNYYILLIDSDGVVLLDTKLKEIKRVFTSFYHVHMTMNCSLINDMSQLSDLYEGQLINLEKYYYWLEDKITNQDTKYPEVHNFEYDLSPIKTALSTNNVNLLKEAIESFFDRLTMNIFSKKQMNYYLQKLLSEISSFQMDGFDANLIRELLTYNDQEGLTVFKNKLLTYLLSKLNKNHRFLTAIYSDRINRLIEIIHSDFSNCNLSLKSIANEQLYLNKDYIGKNFKQETGLGFNEYLLYYRIENAKLILLDHPNISIKELSEKVGFGANSSHFSRTFKKATHQNPSEYVKNL